MTSLPYDVGYFGCAGHVDFTRNAFSPISKLPPDVLLEIFKFIVGQYRHTSRPGRKIHASFMLSHVCRRWRSVVMDTPILWNVVTFKQSANAYILDIAALELSRDCHLDVVMDVGQSLSELQTQSVVWLGHVLTQLSQHAGRIRSFTLINDTEEDITNFLNAFFALEMPFLELVDVDACDLNILKWSTAARDPIHFPHASSSRNGQSPNLKQLSLSGVRLNWSTWSFNALQTLKITDILYEEFRVSFSLLCQALQLCAGTLESLTLEAAFTTNVGYSLIPPQTIQLPALRELSFGFLSDAETLALVTGLSFPNLERLALRDMTFDMFPNFDMTPCNCDRLIVAIAHRRGAVPLKHLSLRMVMWGHATTGITDANLVSMLGSPTSLELLYPDLDDIAETFMHLISIPQIEGVATSIPVPHLSRLIVHGCHRDLLFDALVRRKEAGARMLEYLCIYDENFKSRNEKDDFMDICSDFAECPVIETFFPSPSRVRAMRASYDAAVEAVEMHQIHRMHQFRVQFNDETRADCEAWVNYGSGDMMPFGVFN